MSDTTLNEKLLLELIDGQKTIAGQMGEVTTGLRTLQQQMNESVVKLNSPEQYCAGYKNLNHRVGTLEVRRTGSIPKMSTVRPAIAGTAAASMMIALFEAIRYWIESRLIK